MSATELRTEPRAGRGDFLRSELGAVFGRRRNLLLLALVAAVPVVIGIALHGSPHTSIDGGRAGVRLDDGAASGVHIALTGLLVTMPLLLPMTVALVAGDSVAGEAQAGTLRYLLTVPVGRTRLLLTKYLTVVGWCAAVTVAAALSGAVTGISLFPGRAVQLLSGDTVPLAAGLGRLAIAAGYVVVMLAAFAAIGVFASTLTDAPLVAMAATLGVAVVGEVIEAVPHLEAVRPWLPTHYWSLFVDVLVDAPVTGRLEHGLLTQAGCALLFVTLAWAQFSGRDVTS